MAHEHLVSASPISWFHDILRFEYAENLGAFLSFGVGFSEELRVQLFQVLPALALIGLTVFLWFSKSTSTLTTVAWCIVLSGGVGNLFDRILHHGRVIDFMNLGIGSLHTGIFNVADVCITLGFVLLLFESLWQRRQPMSG